MPVTPRIYADFNGIEYRQDASGLADVFLTGFGTLASLSTQKLQLKEGLRVVIYEPGDIECEGVAHFYRTRVDPAGRVGAWVVVIDPKQVRDCADSAAPLSTAYPCFGCGHDLFKYAGRTYTMVCPRCHTSVMAPLAPPSDE